MVTLSAHHYTKWQHKMASHVNTSQIFFLNLMRIRFLLDPNAAKVKLDLNALSLNAMNSVWHQT